MKTLIAMDAGGRMVLRRSVRRSLQSLSSILVNLLAVSCLSHAWAAEPPVEDPALESFFQQHLEEWFRLRPLDATRLGDHRFDDRLDDLSPSARQRAAEQTRQTLADLPRRVSRSDLSPDAQVDYDIFEHELEKSLWLTTHTRPFEEDPRVYNDSINDSVHLLLTQSTLPRETNVANVIARMRQIPRLIAQARSNLRNPPRVLVETAIRQNRGAIVFFESDLHSIAQPTSQAEALAAAVRPVVAALRDYQAFLEEDLLPRAAGDWRLGQERFRRKLELELDAGLTADQVLAEAEAEFARVERDLYVIARQLWSQCCPGAVLPPDDPDGRQSTVQAVLDAIARDHSTPESLVADVETTVRQVREFLAAHDLLRLPDPDRCRIIEMPEFQRGNSTAYMNSPPPLDPRAAGFFAVSPPPADWSADRIRSYFEEYNRRMLHILTIHEAYPGHYVQYEYANRHPSLIRKVLGSGVYVEGWAVYTEQMLLDQGYGQGDLALRLTQLKFYLRAVANAILDHRLHCSGWTDDQAFEFLTRRAFQSEGEARLKIIRAQQSSVQLSTYFVGRLGHYRLRQQIQREMGDRFRLGRYHEAVLAQGPIPMKFLPDRVRSHLDLPR